ncbi:sigma-54-dependent transcriptional regulator [Nevskia soli]|uniref:sigma-54-dependent transcriptional regulator n=1 Tax=Nevskia soli TaxID=418856 RepID=UPI0004A715F9|nr:sigma-54 dependent transcriptional regulator [Nevskia soli]
MSAIRQKILIVDDEEKMRRVLEIMLQRMGHQVGSAENGEDALQKLEDASYDLVISDLRMPGIDGAELLGRLREAGNDVPFIIVTAHGSIESAVAAMKNGANDYLLRPFDIETLKLALDRVFATRRMRQQNDFLRAELDRGWGGLIGTSQVMREVYEKVRLVAPNKTAVLVTGETGTGKELIARAIHQASPRNERLFVAVNCAAIPAEMIESELFGYEKGAFTGAHKDRIGRFELASGGTLFLDELTEMPIALQSKLLRVLQDQVIERLGSSHSIPLDLRVVVATNRDPRRAIAEGRLREDLYYRINVFSIELPPLRQRRSDIAPLARHFVDEFVRSGLDPGGITPDALAALERYDWPGNVRELRNVIERAAVLCHGAMIGIGHLPAEWTPGPDSAPGSALESAADAVDVTVRDLDLNRAVDAVESRLIAEALRRAGGNKTRAATLLNISVRSLWHKLGKYGLGD